MKRYIGIDPGKHGGIAVMGADGEVFDVVKMPETPQDLLDFLEQYKDEYTDANAESAAEAASPAANVLPMNR